MFPIACMMNPVLRNRLRAFFYDPPNDRLAESSVS